jgi:membrane glycosyltransferase
MKENIKKLAAIAAGLLPFSALAQLPTPVSPPTTQGPITTTGGIINLFGQILTWVAYIFWIAAAGFVFYAGFLYLTAAGDPEKVKKAGSQLLYAVIAIAIGIMAYGLPVLVQSFLGGR